jgi:hypothetical protein
MYGKLAEFLASSTWAHLRPEDEVRFFQAISSVIADESFNPDRMGEYMAKTIGLPEGQHIDAIDHYVTAAWTVKTYLWSQASVARRAQH